MLWQGLHDSSLLTKDSVQLLKGGLGPDDEAAQVAPGRQLQPVTSALITEETCVSDSGLPTVGAAQQQVLVRLAMFAKACSPLLPRGDAHCTSFACMAAAESYMQQWVRAEAAIA